ncbi:hypothetical protein M0R72_16710 [Candidatus Pacearchaeota archaeon]|nr:hypothetical protein [Candidatus Pacearchaeota archaeon]
MNETTSQSTDELVNSLKPIPFDRHKPVEYIKAVDAELTRIKPLLEAEGWVVDTSINVRFCEDWTNLWPVDDETILNGENDVLVDVGFRLWDRVYEALDLQHEIIVAFVIMMYHADPRPSDSFREDVEGLTFFTISHDS